MSATKFLTFCKLTCVGGSEAGECPCARPTECQMRTAPGFAAARVDAVKRLWSQVDTTDLHPVLREIVEDRAGGKKKEPS